MFEGKARASQRKVKWKEHPGRTCFDGGTREIASGVYHGPFDNKKPFSSLGDDLATERL